MKRRAVTLNMTDGVEVVGTKQPDYKATIRVAIKYKNAKIIKIIEFWLFWYYKIKLYFSRNLLKPYTYNFIRELKQNGEEKFQIMFQEWIDQRYERTQGSHGPRTNCEDCVF